MLIICHVYGTIICLGAEIFETSLDLTGTFFRVGEMVCVLFNLAVSFHGMSIFFQYFGYRAEYSEVLPCYSEQNLERWLGSSIAWFGIVVLVFFGYMVTMILLMVKTLSGQKVSADNSKMFEPRYLSFLANRLCQTFMDFCNENFHHGVYEENKIINRTIRIEP